MNGNQYLKQQINLKSLFNQHFTLLLLSGARLRTCNLLADLHLHLAALCSANANLQHSFLCGPPSRCHSSLTQNPDCVATLKSLLRVNVWFRVLMPEVRKLSRSHRARDALAWLSDKTERATTWQSRFFNYFSDNLVLFWLLPKSFPIKWTLKLKVAINFKRNKWVI